MYLPHPSHGCHRYHCAAACVLYLMKESIVQTTLLKINNINNTFYTKSIKNNTKSSRVVTSSSKVACALVVYLRSIMVRRFLHLHNDSSQSNPISVILLLIIICSYITDSIGFHHVQNELIDYCYDWYLHFDSCQCQSSMAANDECTLDLMHILVHVPLVSLIH